MNKRNSTMLTIAVADGMKPFLVQVAAKEDREGLWNLSSILLPQIGIELKVDPGATGTTVSGDTLAALADGQREFLERTGTQRETWRKDKEERRKRFLEKQAAEKNPPESAGISENPAPAKDTGTRDAAFDSFWSVWPRKVARKAAEKAWAAAWKHGKITADNLPAILGVVKRNASSADWTKDDGRFCPHAATWINGERWNDSAASDPAAPATPATPIVYFNPEDDE